MAESQTCLNLRERLRRLQLALDLVLLGLPLAKQAVQNADPMADPTKLDSPVYCLQRKAIMMGAMNMAAVGAYQILYDTLTERADLEAQIASVRLDMMTEDC